ncbi:hypothetical protein F5148DRAFT_1195917 [Russula earlei]|uniref:Uncharacterized protein n=1 Tax=Russula earlei TaxID=71964 RepID=A0ACC0UB54_9AGAM|nr:hypothetical protein F5148DRAFT_1195917 [Russula earlei]
MSQPRNNLEALQCQIPPQQKSTYFSPAQSPKAPKFKPAKAGSTSGAPSHSRSAIAQLPSFSTPGYGKQKPRPPASLALHTHSSNEAIDISSSGPTSPSSAVSLPHKRSSFELAPALPDSSKRPRIAPCSDKENTFTALYKGKEREGRSPPSQIYTIYAPVSLSEVTPTSSPSGRIGAAFRPFIYKYKDHSDLQAITFEELHSLYKIDERHFHQVRRDLDKLRMRRASDYDRYVLEGLKDLLDDRLEAITNEISARETGSEVTQPLNKSAAQFAPVGASATCTGSYSSTRDWESSVHETQVIDENFAEDGAHISSTSHGSTVVSDDPDYVSGARLAAEHNAQLTTSASTSSSRAAFSSGDKQISDPPFTTSGSRSSRIPAFAAADEHNDWLEAQHGPASDDELWNHVDGNIEDDSVEVVLPDANLPTPMFSAVANLRPPPAETPSEASLKASPHYPEVVEKLRNVFRLKAFRKNQLAAIMCTLDGCDTIVLMPTGGGKSLCYQLPAVCRGGKTSGVTVVVSPLRALMADQVERLRSLSIDVMMLASLDQDGNTMHELRSASKMPSLVYATPEKLYCNENMKATLKGLHARHQLARFVIDEAHLINTWGRDFRSSGYGALFNIRKEYPGIPIVALTATATSEALQDIVTALGLCDYVLLSQSFNRPNLRYNIIPKPPKKGIEPGIVQFIKEKYPDETGIIYCKARVKTEEVAMVLRAHNLTAKHFHAGLADGDRKRIQQQWQNGECKIIVATIAFGMGVDKADVRFVIHYDVPDSVDAYCQETGRAGRDGKVAECLLYYNYHDIQQKIRQINQDKDIDDVQKERKKQAVHTLNQFCLNEVDCRRMLLLNHFTEKFDPVMCNATCDNCASTVEVSETDLTTEATYFVKLIQEVQHKCLKITGPLSIHAFRGTSKQDMVRRTFDTLDHFARGSEVSTDTAKRLFDHLVAREILMTKLEAQRANRAPISYVHLGPKAEEFLTNRQSFILKIRSAKKGTGPARSTKKGPLAYLPPTVSIRKDRPRLLPAADEAIESFSPTDDSDAHFDDDIEVEPEPREPSPPPLSQARQRLRASPSIQVVELPVQGRQADFNRECFKALSALRDEFARMRDCDPIDILSEETLQLLSCILPSDAVAFRDVLAMNHDEMSVQEKWAAFGGPCLDITSKYAMLMR